MKNRIFGLCAVVVMAACFAAGCSHVEKGFSADEIKVINGGGGGVMEVMKSDVPEQMEVLRLVAKPLSDGMTGTDEYELLCRRMLATVKAPENDGVGIAAPQVGISRRLVAVQRFDKAGEPFEFFVNPVIVRYGAETAPGGEGCLSVPSLRGTVERSQEIDLEYRTARGTDTLETVCGFTAVIFQHEIDHLDGILYTDKASSVENEL